LSGHAVNCWYCNQACEWVRKHDEHYEVISIPSAPGLLESFIADALDHKPEIAAWVCGIVILLAALLSGWLGRAMGAAAVLAGAR